MKENKNIRRLAQGGFLTRWLLYLLGSTLATAPLAAIAQTQIVRDGSLGSGPTTALGASGTVTSGGVAYNRIAIPENYGQWAGGNVFHSFQNFSIGSGDGAVFTINAAAANVISRVTGGQESIINGLLALDPGATGSKPNFFFINPAGVTFGAGAVVDVPAAFHVSTANYLKFPDGNFYADPAQASTLSMAEPEAFGFLGDTRATISIRDGALVEIPPSHRISLVGGDIEIVDGGSISTVGGGDIRAVANGSKAQEIPLTGSLPPAEGALRIANGGLISTTATSENSGSVAASAGTLVIDGQGCSTSTGISTVTAAGAAGNAGSIEVVAPDILITEGGKISSETYSRGNAGDISVRAQKLAIDGSQYDGFTGIASNAFIGSFGNTGNVSVSIEKSLSLVDGAAINSDADGAGSAGRVWVTAGSMDIDGKGTGRYTGISSDALEHSTGNAGSVEIFSGRLSMLDGASITSDTFGPGSADQVTVSATELTIDGKGSRGFTGISSEAIQYSTGRAGNVKVTASRLTVVDGGVISSDTYGHGDAGTVSVEADSILVDGRGFKASISSKADEGSSGNAGSVKVNAASLAIVDGGAVNSDTFGSGNAGTVQISARSLTLKGNGTEIQTFISSDANTGSTGNAGDITINAGILTILNGVSISSDTYDRGSAGKVSVAAGDLIIDGKGSTIFTGISSESVPGAYGNAGDVTVNVSRRLSISDGGRVSSDTYGPGAAGQVEVSAANLVIDGNGRETGISSLAARGSSGHAGDVIVNAGNLLLVDGGMISSDTYGAGAAGKLIVTADTLRIEGKGGEALTYISSDALEDSTGNAGDITVRAGNLLILEGGSISSDAYSTGSAGKIVVFAGDLTIDGKGSSIFTGISSETIQGSSGNAGDVNISVAGKLSILNGGRISSDTYAQGDAGRVNVWATTLSIDGQGMDTSISSQAMQESSGRAGDVTVTASYLSLTHNGSIATSTRSASTTGSAGNVEVKADNIRLKDQAQISSDTYGPGVAGNVSVSATGNILVDSSASIRASATAGSSGQTGNLRVTAGGAIDLARGGKLAIQNDATVADPSALVPTLLRASAPRISLIDSQITAASTGNVAASNIQVSTTERLYLDPSSISTSSNLGNGGSITISGGKLVWLDNSQITTSVAGLTGNGGDISITADTLLLTTGFIQANTAARNASGGNVNIRADSLLSSGNTLWVGGSTPYQFAPGLFGFNVIQAAAPTGVSGTVAISTPALDISGSLTQLNTQMIDTDALNRDLCEIGAGSSLTPVGRGGLPPSARDFLRPEFE